MVIASSSDYSHLLSPPFLSETLPSTKPKEGVYLMIDNPDSQRLNPSDRYGI
jgi:hypothetical protein